MSGKPYSKETKQKIKEREEHECFFKNANMCLDGNDLTVAHIFIWKKDNGKPVEKNGMCICRKCHDALDFGIGVSTEQQIKMLRLCQMYLTLFYMEEIKEEEVRERPDTYVKKLTKEIKIDKARK
jgi:predicted restriction endonuclease